MIRLLIVEDHTLMREGLKQLFDGEQDIVVGGEADNGEDVLTLLDKDRFELILLDISIPGIHGVELIGKIRQRAKHTPILVLSMHNEPQIAKRKLKAGVSGYITKDCSPEDLLEAVRKVSAGGRYITNEIAESIAFEVSRAVPLSVHEMLSARELQVLRMFAKGKKVNEIAEELEISNKTVSTHKARLMQKMHIDSDVKLIEYVLAHGMAI